MSEELRLTFFVAPLWAMTTLAAFKAPIMFPAANPIFLTLDIGNDPLSH